MFFLILVLSAAAYGSTPEHKTHQGFRHDFMNVLRDFDSGKSSPQQFRTAGGVHVTKSRDLVDYNQAISKYIDVLDERPGVVFSTDFEYPDRYTRWDIATVDPPLEITAKGRQMTLKALNARGCVLLLPIKARIAAMRPNEGVSIVSTTDERMELTIAEPMHGEFTEEERSRVPSVFTVLRAVVAAFQSNDDVNLGLYGAFGYDLAFQFDPIELKLKRPDDQRDLVLYLPDRLMVVDHNRGLAWVDSYEFNFDGKTTQGLSRAVPKVPFKQTKRNDLPNRDHQPGEYAQLVRETMESFKRGDLFEVVPGQVFYERCHSPPSSIARQLKRTNPSPYSFFINLGRNEYLIGASPEMFVRVVGRRVETCPISGTIKRGSNAIEDAEQVLKLLNSNKDKSELTMCSDVDRNDKSRVCEPGTVNVIGRRQIEKYSKLIHTVDHIEGRLRSDMDAFDAFLAHAWAVTVTGAPKLWAMRHIERHERSPRGWYGGAIGMIKFNGDLNTGLTLRTIHVKDGVAGIRVGATLLFDSDPKAEEEETELKASAMIAAVRDASHRHEIVDQTKTAQQTSTKAAAVGEGVNVLMIDHEDSFVINLANYFRETGAVVTTVRAPVSDAIFARVNPDIVVLSPGPGSPTDFDCKSSIDKARKRGIPIFGVCLGLQALVEAFGGTLGRLDLPMHGKPSMIKINHEKDTKHVFNGLPEMISIGRYHSLFADPKHLPKEFSVTALTADDEVIMAIEHKTEPIAAVQFHPESLMTLAHDAGIRMIENVVANLPLRRHKQQQHVHEKHNRSRIVSAQALAKATVAKDKHAQKRFFGVHQSENHRFVAQESIMSRKSYLGAGALLSSARKIGSPLNVGGR